MYYFFNLESPKESKSGVAYDVILAPATKTEGTPRPSSPPKERPLSQEIIDKKLEDAEKRRLVSAYIDISQGSTCSGSCYQPTGYA